MTIQLEYQTTLKCFCKITGLTVDEFCSLFWAFNTEWQRYLDKHTLSDKPRLRVKKSIRKDSIFKDSKDILLFVLLYLNVKANQEELAKAIGIDQPKVSKYLSVAGKIFQKINDGKYAALSPQKKADIKAMFEEDQ